MTRKNDDGFASRVLMALAAALADCNYKDAEIIVAVMPEDFTDAIVNPVGPR
jgi:broad specificity polyphosphatase/5'/3'-nucleotidase SurE